MDGKRPEGYSEDAVMFSDYMRVLSRRKRFIGYVSGLFFAGSVVISLLLPKVYSATASILPSQQGGSLGIGAQLMGQFQGGLGAIGGGLLGMSSPLDVWKGMLKSQTVLDAVVVRFGLKEAYEKETMEETREALEDNLSITRSKEDILSITVYDKDPVKVAQMANAFVEELDKLNRSMAMSSGGRTRGFVDERLKETKVELAKAEDAMKAFQAHNGAVKLDEQSKAIIEAFGALKAELMAKEIEYKTLQSYSAPSNPKLQMLGTHIAELKKKLNELEDGGTGTKKSSVFIPTDRIPDLSIQYLRLLREAKVQETLYELLSQQLEMARISEANDTPTIQTLDTAQVPEKKAKPKRARIVFFSTIAGALLAVMTVFVLEYAEHLRSAGVNRRS